MTHSILITGTNRGIGLEFTRQYAAAGWRVYACCRNPDAATELNQLATQYECISLHQLDVTESRQIHKLAHELSGQPLDILLNNAGVYGQIDGWFGNTNEQQWLQCFHTNVIAPMKMMEAFVDHVAQGELKTIASLSSKMGSMADNGSGGSYVYRSSKAALNAVMTSAAIDLASRAIKIAILHPGWVLTDMGGPHAEINTEQSVSQMRRILEDLSPASSGSFFDIDGSIIPW